MIAAALHRTSLCKYDTLSVELALGALVAAVELSSSMWQGHTAAAATMRNIVYNIAANMSSTGVPVLQNDGGSGHDTKNTKIYDSTAT